MTRACVRLVRSTARVALLLSSAFGVVTRSSRLFDNSKPDALGGAVYRMVNYECDYCEENSLQTCKQEIENAPVVPRINRRLLREGEQFGVCSGGAVLCDNR